MDNGLDVEVTVSHSSKKSMRNDGVDEDEKLNRLYI